MFSVASAVSLAYCVLVAVVMRGLYLLTSRIWWGEISRPPVVHYREDSRVCEAIFQACSTLKERYSPPLLWGTNGHVQTILFGVFGRLFVTRPQGVRHRLTVSDGSTVTYDFYEPQESSSSIIYIICPGIGNSSESDYICATVHHLMTEGHSVAVLNHVGSLKSEPVTGNRLFTYGGTGDMAAMFQDLLSHYPSSKYVAVGFSMGAGIVVRFIGERETWRKHFICAISIGQGYDPNQAFHIFSNSSPMSRPYSHRIATQCLLRLRRHRSSLLGDTPYTLLKDPKRRENHVTHSGHDCNGFALDVRRLSKPDEERVWQATSIHELDEYYTRRVLGFESVPEMWQWMSCVELMKKIKDFPLLLVNARDDPVVPPELHSIPIHHTNENPCAMFVSTDYGGHLGFFEGGIVCPNTVTWIDRLILEYSKACSHIFKH